MTAVPGLFPRTFPLPSTDATAALEELQLTPEDEAFAGDMVAVS